MQVRCNTLINLWTKFHEFQDLIRDVAKVVNAVVPIVSFKEISKDDWRHQLSDIVEAGMQRPPDLVLCTHLDNVRQRHLFVRVVR